jgi:hypothetical protein
MGLMKVNLQDGKENDTLNPSMEWQMQAFYLQNIADMESANRSLTIGLSRTSGPYGHVANCSEQMITVFGITRQNAQNLRL